MKLHFVLFSFLLFFVSVWRRRSKPSRRSLKPRKGRPGSTLPKCIPTTA